MKIRLVPDFSWKTYFTKALNILRFLIYKIINLLVTNSGQKVNTNTLLLIRLDSIGDYILVRNYLGFFKRSLKYDDFKITLCGNIIWKDLAETFDRDCFDEFIWLDRKKFNNNLFYKYKLLKHIYNKGFEIVIDTTFSREILFGDSIVNTSCAKEKIGSTGSTDSYVKWKRNLLTDKYYTRLITQSSQNLFEFYRNKEFFEILIDEKIDLPKPLLDCEAILITVPTLKEFIIIFPGAQEEKRRWAYEKFAFVIQTVINRTKYDIVIAGSFSDSIIADKLCHYFNSNRIFDMTGKTTLPQLAKLISICKILISNETSAVHFAAAVGSPFFCISNGNHFGRFNPYPAEMKIKSRYFYPKEIENKINDLTYLEKYRFDSDLDINSITPDKIVNLLSDFL